jgi:hypothetical protein
VNVAKKNQIYWILGILLIGILYFTGVLTDLFAITDSQRLSGEFSFVGISPEGMKIISQNEIKLFSIFSRSCTPLIGYDSCWEEAYDYRYGDSYAEAFVRMHRTNIKCDGPECYIGYKFEGDMDKTYVYVNRANTWGELWDYANCKSSFEDKTDCKTGDDRINNDEGRYYLTRNEGDTYTSCPIFVFLDHDNDKADNGDYSFAVAMAGYGWLGNGNCLNLPLPYTPSCTENWQCTSWGSCNAGIQNRQCTDLNNCGTITTKPLESEQCVVECKTSSDTNCDGLISRDELGVAITKWINNQISRNDLGSIITAWAGQEGGYKNILPVSFTFS